MVEEQTKKSEIACSKFDIKVLEKGGITSIPIAPVAYDRVLDLDGKIYRVQIKSTAARPSNGEGSFLVKLRRGMRKSTKEKRKTFNYTKEDIDVLIVYLPKLKKFCWFGPEIFDSKDCFVIRYIPTKNNQKKGVLLLEDYEW